VTNLVLPNTSRITNAFDNVGLNTSPLRVLAMDQDLAIGKRWGVNDLCPRKPESATDRRPPLPPPAWHLLPRIFYRVPRLSGHREVEIAAFA
jgi:hypothetical protein